MTGPAKIYLVLGIVCLFLMALLWSADPSFRYIFIGLALTFFLPALIAKFREGSAGFSFFQNVKSDYESMFRPRQHTKYYTQPNQKGKSFAVVIIALLFIFFVFSIIIVAVVFVEDSADDIFLYERAENFRLSQEYDSAIVLYRQVLNNEPEHLDALTGMGNSFLYSSRYDSALKYFERITELMPDDNDGWYLKALAKNYSQQYGESMLDLRKAIAIDPNDMEALSLAGHNFYNRQIYDSAIWWYERSYDAGNRDSNMLHIMGYIHQTQSHNEDAIRLYQEAISYDSGNVEIYDRLDGLLSGEEQIRYRQIASRYREQ